MLCAFLPYDVMVMALTCKHKKPLLLLILFIFVVLLPCSTSAADSVDDYKDALLKFKASLTDNSALSNWDEKTSPCKWKGVVCSNGDHIRSLQLPNMGLKGKVDLGLLKDLKQDLRGLNFAGNALEGPLPDLNSFGALKTAFLSNNHFSGTIPEDAFEGMASLKKLYLAHNSFTGPIPTSLTNLPKLTDLMLQENKFNGQIPDFRNPNLQTFNVSYNNLEGPIPSSLSKMDSSSFKGNEGVSESGSAPAPAPADSGSKSKPAPEPAPGPADSGSKAKPAPAPADSGAISKAAPQDSGAKSTASESKTSASPTTESKGGSSNSKVTIVAATVGTLLGLAIIVAILVVLCRRKEKRRSSSLSVETPLPSNLQKKTGIKDKERSTSGSSDGSIGGASTGGRKADQVKLSFVRGDSEKFELPDLLRASAEILGSGCFGASYKAALPCGKLMIVKRFKQMNNVGREEFQEHMRRIGRLRHPNLLPLVAYYYRKEEKLLITDYVQRGSLAVHLHGHQAMGRPSLNWATRLKVVKGVAKGLEYLYKELPSLIAPHGHIKSSNILLNEAYEPLITDYGLIPVINQESAQDLMVAYKSHEFVQQGRITKKTDVWGFGILILEILTGKFPANFLEQGNQQRTHVDLPSWVNSVVGNADNKNEVFDKEMGGTDNSQGEMTKLLDIALACCETEVDKRLDLKEAVEKIEELKERDGDEDFYSSRGSEAENKSSRGKSDDFVLT